MDLEKSFLPPPVFLCWTDLDSGEDLRILVQGPPEFLEELRVEGFRLADESDAGSPDWPCVVVAAR